MGNHPVMVAYQHRAFNPGRIGATRTSGALFSAAWMSDEDAKKHQKMLDLIVYGLQLLNEPLVKEGKFDYGDPSYMRRMAEWVTDTAKEKWVRQLPFNMFSHRLNFQLPALFFQLKCQIDIPKVVVQKDKLTTEEG